MKKKNEIYRVKSPSFKEDYRVSNPQLHLFYLKQAVEHLSFLRKAIKKLNAFSNLNMLDALVGLNNEYQLLVKDNAAYADADQILNLIGPKRMVIE